MPICLLTSLEASRGDAWLLSRYSEIWNVDSAACIPAIFRDSQGSSIIVTTFAPRISEHPWLRTVQNIVVRVIPGFSFVSTILFSMLRYLAQTRPEYPWSWMTRRNLRPHLNRFCPIGEWREWCPKNHSATPTAAGDAAWDDRSMTFPAITTPSNATTRMMPIPGCRRAIARPLPRSTWGLLAAGPKHCENGTKNV